MEISWPLFLVLFLLMILINIIYTNLHKSTPNSPPGPRALPIIGNLHQLLVISKKKSQLPHCCLRELARVYGPIMQLHLGEVRTVVVSSPEVAKEVLKTHGANFANRPKILFGKELGYEYSDIGFSPYGKHWVMARKIATMELFSSKRVLSFRGIREEEATNLVQSVSSEAAASGGSVNLSSKIFGFTFDVTTRAVFGERGKDQEAFKAVAKEMRNLLSSFVIADLYPSIKLLPRVTGISRKLKNIIQESDKLLEPMIFYHKMAMEKEANHTEEHLLDILLKIHNDNPHDTEFSLTTDNIKGIILEIYFAGSDSSSTVVEWAMSELLKNPKIMEKAQTEVREVYKAKGRVDEAGLSELKYLKLIIKETLRLHPPAPLLGPRESIKECEICGYKMLPKTQILINGWAIGRDSNYWSQPQVFNPERFEGSSIDYKGNNFELIPFGAGRRICPGLALGVANVELPLAMLLYHFDWKLPLAIKPQELDMDETFGVPAKRKNELFLIPTPYVASSIPYKV